jgi:type II secretory pathway predicted ATPase ExeA
MYQAFFGLQQTPFEPAANSSFLVEAADHRAALEAIAELVRRRVGVISLEGWAGVGKTELLRTYRRGIDADLVRIVPIDGPGLDGEALMAALGEALIGPFALQPSFEAVKRVLADRARAGQATVLLVDDAQDLSDGALKALGALADIGGPGESLLSVVLAGRPPLVALLARPAAAALKGRASGRIPLPPFTPAEARYLINERLRRAGAADPHAILSSEAVEAIVVGAGGIPRRLLTLGDLVLQAGFDRRCLPIDYATAEATIQGDARSGPAPAKQEPPTHAEPGGPENLAAVAAEATIQGDARLGPAPAKQEPPTHAEPSGPENLAAAAAEATIHGDARLGPAPPRLQPPTHLESSGHENLAAATAEATIHGDARLGPAPPRLQPPTHFESSGHRRFAPAATQTSARGAARVVIPGVVLIVALGLGFWLWQQPDATFLKPAKEVPGNAEGSQAMALPSPPATNPPAPPPAVAAAPAPPPAAVPTPAPAPPVTQAPAESGAQAVPAPAPAPEPSDVLFIFARQGDTLRSLYRTAYRAPRQRPVFDRLLTANPDLDPNKPLPAGQLVALPAPLSGR